MKHTHIVAAILGMLYFNLSQFTITAAAKNYVLKLQRIMF